MSRFDPRAAVRVPPPRPRGRLLARVATGVAGFCALAVFWQGSQPAAVAAPSPVELEAYIALEHRAFASAQRRPGLATPRTVPVTVEPGETLQLAVQRAGVGPAEAQMVVNVLAKRFDVDALPSGLAFDAAVATPDGAGEPRLLGLAMRTGPASALTVSRTHDGALRLRETSELVAAETRVAIGKMDGSLLRSVAAAGADAKITGQLVRLLGHQLDFSRDIETGDPFRLVFDQHVTESGRVVTSGDLLYGELEIRNRRIAFYRFDHGGEVGWYTAAGRSLKGHLLRTPLDGARVTSNYGLRMHPILGYTKMHQGIDFGASTGTPVYAAGDGVVVEARVWGGYGNWLRIRHAGGFETGYGHLSGYAAGLRPGQVVRQGQVVAYVGSTGASTGPHLHFETWRAGARVDPRGVRVPQGSGLQGDELAAFRAQRAHIDALLSRAKDADQIAPVQQAALRGKLGAAG
jgi:murein DD-endopeptidase MepM/ murein hydrolase activator NlpD